MSFLLPIIYMALAGIGITLLPELKNVKATPGNWNKEVAESWCSSVRMAPHIGANDPCIIRDVANIAEKK